MAPVISSLENSPLLNFSQPSSSSSHNLSGCLKIDNCLVSKRTPVSKNCLASRSHDLLLTTTESLMTQSNSQTPGPLDFSSRSSQTNQASTNPPSVASGVNSQSSQPSLIVNPAVQTFPNVPRDMSNARDLHHFLDSRQLQNMVFNQNFPNKQQQPAFPNLQNFQQHSVITNPALLSLEIMRLNQQVAHCAQLSASQSTLIGSLSQRIELLETFIAQKFDLKPVFNISLPTTSVNQSLKSDPSNGSNRYSVPTLFDMLSDQVLTRKSFSDQEINAVQSILNNNGNEQTQNGQGYNLTDAPNQVRTSSTSSNEGNLNGSNSSDLSPIESGLLIPNMRPQNAHDFSLMSEFLRQRSEKVPMNYVHPRFTMPSHIPVEELRPNCKVHSVKIGPFSAPMDIFSVSVSQFEPVFLKFRSGSAFAQALFVLHHGSFIAMKSSASDRGRNSQRILSSEFIARLTEITRFWSPSEDESSVCKAVNQKQRNILCSARHCYFYQKCDVCSSYVSEKRTSNSPDSGDTPPLIINM